MELEPDAEAAGGAGCRQLGARFTAAVLGRLDELGRGGAAGAASVGSRSTWGGLRSHRERLLSRWSDRSFWRFCRFARQGGAAPGGAIKRAAIGAGLRTGPLGTSGLAR